jgi:hypothetical protein
MLTPGQPSGLTREDAMALLAEAHRAQRELEPPLPTPQLVLGRSSAGRVPRRTSDRCFSWLPLCPCLASARWPVRCVPFGCWRFALA